MLKRIFTPFPQKGIGSLGGRLAFVGAKPDVDGKPAGRYKGFKPDEYIFAPNKIGDKYEPTKQLDMLRDAVDELYINAHCSKGLDILSNKEDCKAKGAATVTLDDLIAQLKAHSLPPATMAKIKLWVCEGALDNGLERSFAQRFSAVMDTAGYKNCRIFGYTLSVFANYQSTDDDPEPRKRVVTTDKQRLLKKIGLLEQKVAALTKTDASKFDFSNLNETMAKLRGDRDLLNLALTWGKALLDNKNDKEAAMEQILIRPIQKLAMLGEGHGGVGGRASQARKEFKAGLVVPG